MKRFKEIAEQVMTDWMNEEIPTAEITNEAVKRYTYFLTDHLIAKLGEKELLTSEILTEIHSVRNKILSE